MSKGDESLDQLKRLLAKPTKPDEMRLVLSKPDEPDFLTPSGTALRDALAKACEKGKLDYSMKNSPPRITIEVDEGPPVCLEFNEDGSLDEVYIKEHLAGLFGQRDGQ